MQQKVKKTGPVDEFPKAPMHRTREALSIKIDKIDQDLKGDETVSKSLAAIQNIELVYEETGNIFRKINRDPTKNEIHKKVLAYQTSLVKMQNISDKVDKIVRSNSQKSREIQKALDNAISDSAAHHPFAKETRQMVREMNDSEKYSFVRSAIDDKQWVLAESIIGSPPHLSGIKPERQKELKDYYTQKRYPEKIKKKQVHDMLSKNAQELGYLYLKYSDKLKSKPVLSALESRNELEGALDYRKAYMNSIKG